MGSTDVDAAARAWVLKLASGHATAEDASQARQWIAAHPDHQAAFTRARDLWHEAGALEEAMRNPQKRPAPIPARRRVWQRRAMAVAAGLLLVVAGPLLSRYVAVAGADFSSPAGKVSSFKLADGSSVWLDAGAAINVRFSEDRRDVDLVRGRAFFAVTSNPDRPFAVITKNGSATAVGTAYSVSLEQDGVIVTVAEGRVRAAAAGSSELISAGEQGGWTHEKTLKAHQSDVRVAHAWKSGRILIENQRLSDAVDVLDRYRPGIIFVRDRGDVRVSAQFDIERTQQGLLALAQSQHLKIVQWGPWITVLSAE